MPVPVDPIEIARDLHRAAAVGDDETLAARLDTDVHWYGRQRGHLWWRRQQSCHGRDEASESFRMLRVKIPQIEPDELTAAGDRVLVGFKRKRPDGDLQWYRVLTVRDDKVVEIRDFRHRREAARALRH